MTEGKKKLKSLIRFHSANKIDNYNGVRGEEKKNPEKKKSGSNYKTKILTLFGFHKNTPRQGLSRRNLAGT